MTIYQISIKSFFTGSNGCDYAMAVDMNDEIKLFTSERKAKKLFNNLVEQYCELYKTGAEYIENHQYYFAKVIYHGTSRTIIEFIKKKLNKYDNITF